MQFTKMLVTTETDFYICFGDFLFSDALKEGMSEDRALDELWDICCQACEEEGCEGFVILMDDGTFRDFFPDEHDKEEFKKFVRKYLWEVLEDYKSSKRRDG
jgi:hypothetical protein